MGHPARIQGMSSDKIHGIKRLLLGIFSIALSAIIAQSEYDEVHSSEGLKFLFDREVWITVAIFGVLGIAGIGSGIWAWRKSRHD